MTGENATRTPHEIAPVWECNSTNNNSKTDPLKNHVVLRTLGNGHIAMFTITPVGTRDVWISADPVLPSTQAEECLKTSSRNVSASDSLDDIDLSSRISDIQRYYHASLLKIGKEWYRRVEQCNAILAIANGNPFCSINMIKVNALLVKDVQSLHMEIAGLANPKRQEEMAQNIVWFSVRGKSVCLLKSTILSVIPNSLLAIRIRGEWVEQESTLDREGRIFIVSAYNSLGWLFFDY
jgi:hypothetical protein